MKPSLSAEEKLCRERLDFRRRGDENEEKIPCNFLYKGRARGA
jgi:hypothetical protein